MAGTTVRVDHRTRDVLLQLAALTGDGVSTVLARAVEWYRRECILDEANAAYSALRADPQAWAEELAERRAWGVSWPDDRKADR